VCELLSPRAHGKGLEIAWAAAPALPTVVSDEGRLRQILFNIAGNAVKFTEHGGVLLTADATPAGPGRATLRVSVADTGPGVPFEAQARIFDEFTHAAPGDGVRYGGTGLGLAIVRRLAEALGRPGHAGQRARPGLHLHLRGGVRDGYNGDPRR
jgi:signal transduction histidine kinase